VALESLGLGSVYIGAMRQQAAGGRQGAEPAAQRLRVFGMAVGFPDPRSIRASNRASASGRAALRAISMGGGPLDAINTLDAKFRDFQKEQGLPEQGWIRQVLSRVRGPTR